MCSQLWKLIKVLEQVRRDENIFRQTFLSLPPHSVEIPGFFCYSDFT